MIPINRIARTRGGAVVRLFAEDNDYLYGCYYTGDNLKRKKEWIPMRWSLSCPFFNGACISSADLLEDISHVQIPTR